MSLTVIYENIRNGAYESKIPYNHEDAASRRAYNEDRGRLEDHFRNDLFAAFDVSDNPKRDKAYSLAWGYGHSAGYSEVATYFSDIVELIK